MTDTNPNKKSTAAAVLFVVALVLFLISLMLLLLFLMTWADSTAQRSSNEKLRMQIRFIREEVGQPADDAVDKWRNIQGLTSKYEQ